MLGAYARDVATSDAGKRRGSARTGSRIGIFGGTFDPVHVGHLVAATWAREALELDRVLLVVANVPWQKAGDPAPSTAAEDRFLMVQAAVHGVPGSRRQPSGDRPGRSELYRRHGARAEGATPAPALRDRGRRCGRRARTGSG